MERYQKVNTICLLILTLVALAFVSYLTKTILIPFTLSIFIWLVYSPILKKLQVKLKLPKGITLTISLIILIGFFLLVTFFITSSIDSFAKGANQYSGKLNEFSVQLASVANKLGVNIESFDIQEILKKFPVVKIIKSVSGGMLTLLSHTFLVVIFSIFLLTGESLSENKISILEEIKENTRQYVSTKILISLGTSICTYIVLFAFDIEMAFMFSILAFLLNFIPNIGSLIAVALPIPIIILQYNFGIILLVVFILLLGIQLFFGNVLEPKLMGESIGLHPVSILLSLAFFGFIWGITGMFLSVPMLATLKIILSKFELTSPVSDLLEGKVKILN